MASYDAQINLLVAGQRELTRLADRLRAIERQIIDINSIAIRPQPRDPATGRFTRDPDREVRLRAARLRRIGQEEERNARLVRSRLVGQNAELERSILYQSRLNSAVELYQRKLQEFSRGGSGQRLTQDLRDQVVQIQSAYEAATSGGTRNLRLVRSLATELGRVVERQNEINRTSTFQSKGFFESQAFERRISGLREAGLPVSAFSGVGRQMAGYRSALSRGNQPEAQDFARRIKENLDRLARELDQAFAEFRRGQSVQKAARSWEKFFEDASAEALRIKQNSAETRQSWQTFFEDAAGQALLIRQNTKDAKDSWKGFFDDAASQALRVRQNTKDTSDSWRIFFEDAGAEALKIKQDASRTSESWKDFFENAAYQALQIKQNAKETSDSWRVFFSDAAEQAFLIKQNAKETKESWRAFFEDAANQAFLISQNSKETRSSWQAFFEDAASQALQIKQNSKETRLSWKNFFDDAAYQAFAIKEAAKNTRASWERFFEDAEEQARLLRRRPISAMSAEERVSTGVIDFPSLRASRKQRVASGRARQEAIRRAASEGLIGGAFPLLFGQGIGAAALGGLGGAAGGFAGGGLGFGLSLVGTALGTAFDAAVQSATELGAALNDTTQTFDKVKERALFSSKETEKLGDSLQELGFVASAAILSQQEVVSKIGASGANSLARLGDVSDKLNRAWAELNLQLQAALAGPMAGLLEWVSDIVGIANQRGRSQAAARDLIPQDEAGRKRFEKELTSVYNQTYGTSFAGSGTPRGSIEETIKYLSMDEKGRAALAELSKTFKPIELDVKIKEKQQIEEEIARLGKELEIIDLGKSLIDQVRQAAREQQDLDKQRADLVRSYEESIGDIRKRVEDEIRNRRFATLEKENQLLDLQGQIRLKQLQIVNQATIAQAGVGERPEVEQAAKEIAQIVAQFTEQQLSAEEEAASIKRNAALDVQKIDSEAAQFKANIEREVSRLNIETARRVADINEQVRRRNEEFDLNRFKLEKAIAELQLKNNEIITEQQLDTARKNLETAKKAGDAQGAAYAQSFVGVYQSQLDIIKKGQQDISAISAPARLRGVGQVGGGSVSTAGLDRATADYRAAVENYVAAQLRLNELDVVKNAQDFAIGITEFANKTDAVLAAIQTRESDAEIERLRYIELVNAGLTDTVAQKVIELETAKRVALAVYDTAIAQLKNKIVAGEVTAQVDAQNRAYLKQIKILKQRKDALEGKFGEVDTATGQGTGAIGQAIESGRGKKIQDFIAQATAELNDLEAVAVRVSQSIGDAIGNSISNGITGLVEGTATAKEVFAGFMKDVGQILIQEGAKMIATYVAIGIARMFAGLFGGGGGGYSAATDFQMPGAAFIPSGGFSFPGAADGAYFDGGMAYFAKGGIVSSPTLFQFADGGVPQAGLMGEAGPEAIMPLKRGADGKLGVAAKLDGAMGRYRRSPGSADGPAGGAANAEAAAGSVATMEPIDVRYSVERINNVDYVTADQFQAGMAQAAQQGAIQGERRAMRTLGSSPAARRRLGI